MASGTFLDAADSTRQRKKLAATWTSLNPVLDGGAIGYETDTGKAKLGDGSTTWVSLPYLSTGGGGGGNVVTGIQGGTNVVSITSTAAGAGSSEADANQGIAIGVSAFVDAGGTSGIAIGENAAAGNGTTGIRSIAIGYHAKANQTAGDTGVAIGITAQAAGDGSIAIDGIANGAASVAIGPNSNLATGASAISLGDSASAIADSDIVIGGSASTTASDANSGGHNVVIGAAAFADTPTVHDTVVIGHSAYVQHYGAIAIGAAAQVSDGGTSLTQAVAAIAIGDGASAQAVNAMAIGPASVASGVSSLAIGDSTSATHGGGVALGSDNSGGHATTAATNDFVLGTALHNYKLPGTVLGLRKAIVTKSANYTLTDLDSTVLCTGTNTQTLPTAVGRTGRVFTVKNVGVGVTTVGTTSAQNIDSATTKTLAALAFVTVQSDGTQWWIVG